MIDQDTLKEIAARLRGRIEITYRPEDRDWYESFEIWKDGNCLHIVQHRFHGGAEAKAWAEALSLARQHEGVIFGPPGYDVGL